MSIGNTETRKLVGFDLHFARLAAKHHKLEATSLCRIGPLGGASKGSSDVTASEEETLNCLVCFRAFFVDLFAVHVSNTYQKVHSDHSASVQTQFHGTVTAGFDSLALGSYFRAAENLSLRLLEWGLRQYLENTPSYTPRSFELKCAEILDLQHNVLILFGFHVVLSC